MNSLGLAEHKDDDDSKAKLKEFQILPYQNS